MPRVADSLAGRMEIIRLHHLSKVEIGGHQPGFLDRVFADDYMVAHSERLGPKLADLIVRGGFSEAVLGTLPPTGFTPQELLKGKGGRSAGRR